MPASSERDRDLISKLQGWVEDATQTVRDLHTKWDKYGDFYQGVQDEGVDLSKDASLDWAPVNLVYSTVSSIVPVIKDSVPLWYVKALHEGLPEGLEDQLTDALQAIWYMRRVSREYGMSLVDQALRGTGFLKVWWNPNIGPEQVDVDGRGRIKRSHKGDVDVSWLDPYSVYPDPAARSLEECEWLALASDMAPERAARIYDGSDGGTKFDEKKGQLVEDDTQRPQSLLSRAIAWVVGRLVSVPPGNRQTYRIWEVYHEGGRRLTIFSGQQLLWDGDNPTPGEQFPVVCLPMCERGESFWGMPITSQIIGLQTKINKWHLMIQQHLRILGRMPVVTNDQGAAQQITQNDGRVGLVVQVRGADGFAKIMDGPPLPSWMFAYGREMYEDVKTVSGVQDVMRGLRPGSVQSGIGIQSLQESAMTRVRETARDNALQLERLGQIVLDMMQEKYDEERSFAYHNGTKFVRQTVTPDMLKQERLSPEAPMSELAGPEADMMGGMMGPAGLESVQVPIPYRVVVEPGGNLPLNAMAQAEVAFKAAQTMFPDGPGIDREAFLEALKFPHRQEIVQRMAARQAEVAQGQMAAQEQQMQMAQQAAMMGGAAGQGAGETEALTQQLLPLLNDPDAANNPQALMLLLQIAQQTMARGAGPGGAPEQAPEGAGPPPQQDLDTIVQSLLAPIMAMLDEQDQALLLAVIEQLLGGQPLTPEQEAWLESLPAEVQQAILEVLQALGMDLGGAQAPVAGAVPQMGLV